MNIQKYCRGELTDLWVLVDDFIQLNHSLSKDGDVNRIYKISKNLLQRSGQLKHHLCRGTYNFSPNMSKEELHQTSNEIGETFVISVCTLGAVLENMPGKEQQKIHAEFPIFKKMLKRFQPVFEEL